MKILSFWSNFRALRAQNAALSWLLIPFKKILNGIIRLRKTTGAKRLGGMYKVNMCTDVWFCSRVFAYQKCKIAIRVRLSILTGNRPRSQGGPCVTVNTLFGRFYDHRLQLLPLTRDRNTREMGIGSHRHRAAPTKSSIPWAPGLNRIQNVRGPMRNAAPLKTL